MPTGTPIDPAKAEAIRRVTAALDGMAALAAQEAARVPLMPSHAPKVPLMPSHEPRQQPTTVGGKIMQRVTDWVRDSRREGKQAQRDYAADLASNIADPVVRERVRRGNAQTMGVSPYSDAERAVGAIDPQRRPAWAEDPLGRLADWLDEQAGTVEGFNPVSAVARLFSGDLISQAEPGGPGRAMAKAVGKGGKKVMKIGREMIDDVIEELVERGVIPAESAADDLAEAVAKKASEVGDDDDGMAAFFSGLDDLAGEEAADPAARAVDDLAEDAPAGGARVVATSSGPVGPMPGPQAQGKLFQTPKAKIELDPNVAAEPGVMPAAGQGELLADSDAAQLVDTGKVEPIPPTMAPKVELPTTLDTPRDKALEVPAARAEGAEFVRGVGETKQALDDGGTFDEAVSRTSGIRDAPKAWQAKRDDVRQARMFTALAGADVGGRMFQWFKQAQNGLWKRRRMGLSMEEISRRADDYVPNVETLKGLEDTTGWMPGSVEELAGLEKGMAAQYEYAMTVAREIQDTLDSVGVKSLDELKGATDPALVAAREKLLADFSDDAGRNLRSLDELAQFRAEQINGWQVFMKVFEGARSEWGRSGRWLGEARKKFLRAADGKFIARAMKGGVVPEQAFEFLAKLPDPAQKMRFLMSLSKPRAEDWVRWYYMTSLLSNPRTHLRNIVGNLTYNVLDMAGTPLRAALTKDGDAAAEFVAQWGGMRQGFHEGWKAMKFVFENGFTLDDAAVLAERPVTLAMGTKWEKPINAVSRALEGVDQGLQAMGRQIEIHRMIASRVRKEGHKLGSEAFEKRFAELVTDPPVEVLEQAKKRARDLVYRQDPGSITKSAIQMRRALDEYSFGVGGTVLMPFITTPANVMRAGVQHTPLGMLTREGRSAIRKGLHDLTPEEAQRVTRSVMGTTAAGVLALWALEGNVTGSAPADAGERDYMYANGPKPNSVRVPGTDTWVGMQTLGPLALPLMAAGNLVDQIRKGGSESMPAAIGEYLARVGKSITDQSYLSSLFGLANAITSPEQHGERTLSRLVSGALPLSGAMRFARDLTDRTLRDPDTVGESVMAGLPGLSHLVPARVAFDGQEARRADSWLGQLGHALLPVEVSRSKPTPAHDWLRDMGEYFPNPMSGATSFATRLGKDAAEAGKLDRLVEAGVLEAPGATWKGEATYRMPHALQVEYAKGLGEKRLALVEKLMASGTLEGKTREEQAAEVRRLFDRLSDRYARHFVDTVVRSRVKGGAR